MIEVVSAFVVLDGFLFLQQRPREKKMYPSLWETPGGKVEGNESHHEALKREIREELGVEVDVAQAALTALVVDQNSVAEDVPEPFHFVLYAASFVDHPTPRERQGVGWFTRAAARGLDLTPGTRLALMQIKWRGP